MKGFNTYDISRFFLCGISHQQSAACLRDRYAVPSDRYRLLLQQGAALGLHEFFIIYTCNRTEIAGFADDPYQLISFLCGETTGDPDTFRRKGYQFSGQKAVSHLFEVAAGLDSRLLGDYEIVGQIKESARLAREAGCLGSFTERLISGLLQSSKKVKNNTSLSNGTASVSYSAVQYIKALFPDAARRQVLLVGTGKIGNSTCRNLVKYLGTKNIILVNRTDDKSARLAEKLGLGYMPFQSLNEAADMADIIITATDSTASLIHAGACKTPKPRLLIDLAIPGNIDPDLGLQPGCRLIRVDVLCERCDATLALRKSAVPLARQIIRGFQHEFLDWVHARQYAPVLKALKSTLYEMKEDHPRLVYLYASDSQQTEQQIHRVISRTANKLNQGNQKGCHYIEAINEFLATGT